MKVREINIVLNFRFWVTNKLKICADTVRII